jgi:hypothetical protein
MCYLYGRYVNTSIIWLYRRTIVMANMLTYVLCLYGQYKSEITCNKGKVEIILHSFGGANESSPSLFNCNITAYGTEVALKA